MNCNEKKNVQKGYHDRTFVTSIIETNRTHKYSKNNVRMFYYVMFAVRLIDDEIRETLVDEKKKCVIFQIVSCKKNNSNYRSR